MSRIGKYRTGICPFIGGGGTDSEEKQKAPRNREHTAEDGYRFAALFSGLG